MSTSPDLPDLHGRIATREQRVRYGLVAALALALVAGPVAGWAVARQVEPEADTVAVGGGDSDGGGGSTGVTNAYGGSYEGPGIGFLDELEPVSDRTTAAGIRLVVRTSGNLASEGACAVDGLVRVGIVDGDLVDVLLLETAPGGASYGIAGGANGRPMWVVVARSTEGTVEATFESGVVDVTEPSGGVVVLAGYGSEGFTAPDLGDDAVQVTGLPGDDGPRAVTLADGTGGCQPPSEPTEPIAMPDPGEPPADEDAARAEIEELFSGFGGQDPDDEMHEHERPNVWRDADTRFREEHPNYLEWARESYGVPLEIVFTAPDRATVRYDIRSDNPSIPAPGERLGEAVLIDGAWKVSIETSCADIGLAGIECDYSIEG